MSGNMDGRFFAKGCQVFKAPERVVTGNLKLGFAICETQDEEHAAVIASALNNHDTLVEALRAIADLHTPSQPAASGLSEYEWALQHVGRLRGIARAALTSATREGE